MTWCHCVAVCTCNWHVVSFLWLCANVVMQAKLWNALPNHLLREWIWNSIDPVPRSVAFPLEENPLFIHQELRLEHRNLNATAGLGTLGKHRPSSQETSISGKLPRRDHLLWIASLLWIWRIPD